MPLKPSTGPANPGGLIPLFVKPCREIADWVEDGAGEATKRIQCLEDWCL